MNTIKYNHMCLILLLLCLVSSTLVGCPRTTMTPEDLRRIGGFSEQAPGGADDFIIVDCSLPGQIRQLGQRMVFLSRGPSKKLTAGECASRGGVFLIPDQSDYTKALMVWQPDADKGEPEAQYYVGQIYQRGLGAAPDYSRAAEWYHKAAGQGYAKAQMSLGYLYEKGLGVEKDPRQALSWYRKVTGLGDSITLDENALSIEELQELQELRRENKLRKEETKMLQQRLKQTQKELEDTRRILEQQKSDLDTEKKEVEQARLELEQRKKKKPGVVDPVLQELEEKLNLREADIERQSQKVARLQSELGIREEEAQNYRAQLSEFEQKFANLPGPKIEIYDLLPQAMRGVRLEPGGQDLTKRQIAGMVWAPAGLDRFEVNNKRETVDEDGKFRVSVPLKPSGDTYVQIVAFDVRDQRASIKHKLTRSVSISSTGSVEVDYSPIKFGRYHGLIIGNIRYSKLSPLETAVNDAQEIAEILRDKYGFNTTLLLDASRDEIIQALDRFRTTLTENDNLLIYYAGHGYLDRKNKRGYWQPVDADPDSIANWIPDYAITDMLNIMSAKEVLIIADSCYSGILTRSGIPQLRSGQSPEVRLRFLKKLAQGQARMVLTSGGLEPVLDSVGGDHSAFAKVLLDVLESNDQVIEGRRLHQEINARVLYESERFGLPQVPEYATNIRAGHESGDFIFVPKKYQKIYQ